MRYIDDDVCPHCNAELKYELGGHIYTRLMGIEYIWGSKEHYDGVSEWMCPFCNVRWGRWTGKILKDGEIEPRFGGES